MQLERKSVMVKILVVILVIALCIYVIIDRICMCIERVAFLDKIKNNILNLEDFRDGKK